MNLDYNGNKGVGKWITFNGAKFEFSSKENSIIITADSSKQYMGIQTSPSDNSLFPVGKKIMIMIDMKGLSGNYTNMSIDRADFSKNLTGKVTSDWKSFILLLDNTNTNTNTKLSILTYTQSDYSVAVRNIYFAIEGTYEYKMMYQMLILQNSIERLNNKIQDVKTPYDDKDGSFHRTIIENKLSDIGIPSWVGKAEFRNTDLIPSINNAGQSYLFMNGSDLELRIVKNATTIVGMTLSEKFVSQVESAKTFSMCHFGDSITYGVGSNPNYVTRLKTLLEADGHTITTQTNLGISGTTAEGIANSYRNASPVHHDIATLMIGINDQDKWLRNKNTTWETTGIDPEGFRAWFRTSLADAINVIQTYSTCDKFFIIVPYPSVCEMRDEQPWPSKWSYYSQPLQQVIIQETIRIAEMLDLWICRADYYVPNSTDYVPDGLHANNNGAQLLAQGLREEITFRIP